VEFCVDEKIALLVDSKLVPYIYKYKFIFVIWPGYIGHVVIIFRVFPALREIE
jgi:hypothetical protein